MSLMNEYISRNMSISDLEDELQLLIRQYNSLRNTYLLVFTTDMIKNIPGSELIQDDYYIICDILHNINSNSLDIFIETPGGKGNTAEDIVKFIRSKFQTVNFVISGEAKSAGTIMVLSADDIIMTATGSLGPIDAQVKLGRMIISASDYKEWIEEKRKEALKLDRLNPLDAIIIAQISPGEYKGIFHALKYAEDLAVDWLPKYKFKNWNCSETQGIKITQERKIERAREIAEGLCDHGRWRDHGRSIKREDLEGIGLRILNTESVEGMDELVRRIHTVTRLMFGNSQIFKMFVTQDRKIHKQAAPRKNLEHSIPAQNGLFRTVKFNARCDKCGKIHNIYVKFENSPDLDSNSQKDGSKPFPKDGNIYCECGFVMNLNATRNKIEMDFGRKIII